VIVKQTFQNMQIT